MTLHVSRQLRASAHPAWFLIPGLCLALLLGAFVLAGQRADPAARSPVSTELEEPAVAPMA
jgi:ABC-type dipeptide/oligopeptide/nickel transport system permease subunit